MGRPRGDDPESSRWPALLLLLPGDQGGELRRALVRAAGVSSGRDHVRQPCGVAQPGPGAAAGSVVRPGRPARGAAAAAAGQSGARGSGGTGGSGLARSAALRAGALRAVRLDYRIPPRKRGPMWRAPFSGFLFLGMLVTPVHAQRDTTACLAGTVRSSINGLPISGVMVAVRGSGIFDASDSTGSFK